MDLEHVMMYVGIAIFIVFMGFIWRGPKSLRDAKKAEKAE